MRVLKEESKRISFKRQEENSIHEVEEDDSIQLRRGRGELVRKITMTRAREMWSVGIFLSYMYHVRHLFLTLFILCYIACRGWLLYLYLFRSLSVP